jgi:hypothetical protein
VGAYTSQVSVPLLHKPLLVSPRPVPRNTTPCPQCGTPVLTVRRRYGPGMVTLDLRRNLRCFQVVITGTDGSGSATAAESMAYPEHGPLCPGRGVQCQAEADAHDSLTAG